MNSTQRNAMIFVVGLVCVGGGVFAYRMMVSAPAEKEPADPLVEKTSSESQYKHSVVLAADAFSGYAVLRSPAMSNQLRKKGIKLTVQDDAADYGVRMKALQDGTTQMAVFTIDSFVAAGAKLGSFPAAIVMLIDETKGADAIVSYKQAISSIEDLDADSARFVLTQDSPSEFLARVAVNTFSLPSLPDVWWETADGAGDVLAKLRRADKAAKRAYVLWQPYVSQALEVPGVHVLLGSDKLDGLIVDVLVCNRKFLAEKPAVVRDVVEAYLRSAHSFGRGDSAKMVKLVVDDSGTGPDRLSDKQASELVAGIQWKNTSENYAHFGLLTGAAAGGVRHIEDMIDRITKVLTETGKLKTDPAKGAHNTLFYDGVLRELQAAKFHPGQGKKLVSGLGPTQPMSGVKQRKKLTKLSKAQWDTLRAVGSMRVEPIGFGRGTATLSSLSRGDLDALIERLDSFPEYYLRITGRARAEGDPEANRQLAHARAEAVADYLRSRNVPALRVDVRVATPDAQGGASQSVSFLLGQPAIR